MRIHDSKYIIKHKVAIFKLWLKYETKVSLLRVINHDLEKLLLKVLFGDKTASRIHRKIAKHHNISSDNDFYEAYLDWASARITKPDKPLDAIETAEQYYPIYTQKAIKHYYDVNFK